MAISKFVPRTDGTGSIGTSSLAWNEGHFNDATFKQDITVTGNADIGGTATISNINSTNVTVTGGIEFASGTTSLQGESSPTGAAPSSTIPMKASTDEGAMLDELHLYALPDNKFFTFSLFGDLSIKEGKAPWRKIGKGSSPFDSSYFSATGMTHATMSDGSTRLWLSVHSSGNNGARAYISDDFGENWTNSGVSAPHAGYYGGGRSKVNEYSLSNDIRTYDDLVHWRGVYSYYNNVVNEQNPATGKPWTVAELTENHLTGDNDQASRLQHGFLPSFTGWYQCYNGDDLWSSAISPGSLITVDMVKNFKILSNGEFASFGQALGQNYSGLSASARRLSSRVMGDSRWDIMASRASTYPGEDTIYTWVHGVKKILTALANGETVDDAWFNQHSPNDFWIGTFSSRFSNEVVVHANNDLGSSNGDVIYMYPYFYPVDFVSRPDDFVNINKFDISGPKRHQPYDSDGDGLGAVKIKYIDESTLFATNVRYGRSYEIDTASLRSALLLNNADGSDWNIDNVKSAITKYKPSIIVEGVDVPLEGGGGEASNTDTVATSNIHQYDSSGPNGAVVGLGDNGYATYRDLALDNYDSPGAVWTNTTANSFSVPAFSGGGVYHTGLKKLHFDFRKSYNYSVPSLSVDSSNNWGSGFVSGVAGMYEMNQKWDDYSTPKYGGTNGDAQYLSQYKSTGISMYYTGNMQVTTNVAGTVDSSGYGTMFPGSGRNYTPPGYLSSNRQTYITLSNGDTLVTLYARMNSGTWTTDRWVGWYATQLTQYADETLSNRIAARAFSNTHDSSGDSMTYYQTCFTINNRMTRNSKRNDFSSHPDTIDAIVMDRPSAGLTLSGSDTGMLWGLNTDGSGKFRKVGIFFAGQTGAVAFTRPSDDYDFENATKWTASLVCRRDISFNIPIASTRVSRDGWVTFDFTTPNSTVSSLLSDAGIDANTQANLVYSNPNNSAQKRLGVHFQVIKSDGTQGFRKYIELRDGSPSDWADQPLPWQSRLALNSIGQKGWIFGTSSHGDDVKYIWLYQMPNGDLIAGRRNNWKVVAIESLDGDNGMFIDDPTWLDRAARPEYFGKSFVDEATVFDGVSASINRTITALGPNHLLVYRGNTTVGFIHTDGNGNLVKAVKLDVPNGQTARSTMKAVKANNTLYYVNPSEGRIWYTDIAALLTLGEASNTITPTWTEINPSDTGLTSIYGISYHPDAETYYLSGNSGLYSKSTDGKANWSIDISPQYAFASQPTTGLYKDLEHTLHLVHKGDLSLTIGEESVGIVKPLGLGTKNPDSNKNLTIQALSDASGDQTVIQFKDLIGEDIGKIEVDTGTNTTKYTTASDYRLKLNINSFHDPINRLMSLNPCSWTWKNSGLKGEGFIAHEVSDIIPEAVSGKKDAVKVSEHHIPNDYSEEPVFDTVINEDGEEVEVQAAPQVSVSGQTIRTETPVYQSIDQSKIVPLLTASLQETIKELNSLKGRIDKLENN